MARQSRADAIDAEMMKQLLQPSALAALHGWLAGPGAAYAIGAGTQAVAYVPAYWVGVEPWPHPLGSRSSADPTSVSRTQVVEVSQEALKREAWMEVLVASYVWGQGRTGYGPHRLRQILAQPRIGPILAESARALQERGAVAAYRVLDGAVKGLGPAFYTKFVYFLDQALGGTAPGPRALILDQRVARVLRAHAARLGQRIGIGDAADIAEWVWSDSGWTPYRYSVYLRWAQAVSAQLSDSGVDWPDGAPDLLELALFNGAWAPEA